MGTNEPTKRRNRTKMIELQDPLRATSGAHFRGIRDKVPYQCRSAYAAVRINRANRQAQLSLNVGSLEYRRTRSEMGNPMKNTRASPP